jgi:hypothetical protein
VIAASCVVLDLLSAGAGYGVMTAVSGHGWGATLAGTHAPGAIESWIPLFLVVILFGVSMDYHMFVVSRIRAAREAGLATARAVPAGIRAAARGGDQRRGHHGGGVHGLRHAASSLPYGLPRQDLWSYRWQRLCSQRRPEDDPSATEGGSDEHSQAGSCVDLPRLDHAVAAAVIVEVFPAGSSRTASAPCASINARSVGADPGTGTGTGGAGRVRRLRT